MRTPNAISLGILFADGDNDDGLSAAATAASSAVTDEGDGDDGEDGEPRRLTGARRSRPQCGQTASVSSTS
jgi:hypothetical protein